MPKLIGELDCLLTNAAENIDSYHGTPKQGWAEGYALGVSTVLEAITGKSNTDFLADIEERRGRRRATQHAASAIR